MLLLSMARCCSCTNKIRLDYFWTQGTVTKSSLDNTTTSKMAGLVKGITNQARSVVRDLDPVNELAFLRLRSTKTEFLIAPGNEANKKGSCVNDLCFFFRQGLCAGGSSDPTIGVNFVCVLFFS